MSLKLHGEAELHHVISGMDGTPRAGQAYGYRTGGFGPVEGRKRKVNLMRIAVRLEAPWPLALALSGGPASAAVSSAQSPMAYTCAGGEIPSGNYASITVTGVCGIPVHGQLGTRVHRRARWALHHHHQRERHGRRRRRRAAERNHCPRERHAVRLRLRDSVVDQEQHDRAQPHLHGTDA